MGIGTFVKPSARPPAISTGRGKQATGDIVLVAVVVVLCIFGLLMVFSASTDASLLDTYNASDGSLMEPYKVFYKQALFMVLGALVAAGASYFNYRLFIKLSVPMMVVSLALLVGVLIFGVEILGSKRTFINGSLQPSEVAKLATIIYLAVWLYSKGENLRDVSLGLVPLAVILGIIGGLIFLEPDFSATITIFLLGGLLFFLSGGDLKQIVLLLIVSGVVVLLFVLFSNNRRVTEFTAGLEDPLNSGDHMLFSLESILNGGLFGKGIGKGAIKVEGLSFAATDSIFAVIVEECGLFGASLLIGLYGVLVWRGVRIAQNAPDQLGKMIAGGITFWIGTEALIHMAVLVGLMPFAGNALPFISAGGSNLITMLAAIGLLVGISRQRGTKSPEPVLEERRSYSASADLRRGDRRRSISRPRRP